MLNTIIFLNRSSYAHYDFESMPELARYRKVAIIDDDYAPQFPEKKKPYFDHIYSVQTHNPHEDHIEYALDYQQTCDVIEQEIVNAGGAERVYLYCGDEQNTAILGKLRDQFSIVGVGHQQLTLYRDKILMKQRLYQCGVRAPKVLKFDRDVSKEQSEFYFNTIIEQLKLPFIFKPVQGLGSTSTFKVSDYEMFQRAIAEAETKDTEFEMEEFISGVLYHCDTMLHQGQLIVSIVSEYNCPNLAFQHGKKLASIPLPADWPLTQRIKSFNQQALQALGNIDGASHMEIFVSDADELIFLEVGSRPPGANVNHNFINMFSYNMFNHDLLVQLGKEITPVDLSVKINSFEGILPIVSGKIKRLVEPEFNSQCDVQFNAVVGDVFESNATSIYDVMGWFSIANRDYDALYRDFKALDDWQYVEME